MLKDLVKKNRSYRRFDESSPVSMAQLTELIDLARFTPSAANRQPLRYLPIAGPDEAVFACLGWAAALKDWPGPEKGERPAGYIVMLADRSFTGSHADDVGIAAQTVMLGAAEMGLGGCMLGSVNREKLTQVLGLDPEKYEIELVLALGKPVEEVRLTDMPESGDFRYWRDENRVHFVPKRALSELIVKDPRI